MHPSNITTHTGRPGGGGGSGVLVRYHYYDYFYYTHCVRMGGFF